jgi:hypothetical protein
MFPQVRRKTWAIRPAVLPPFVGRVNHWQPVSTDCSNPLVYGGGVNSRGQHHAKSRSSREIGRYRRSQTSRRGLRVGLVVALVVVVGSTAWLASRVLMVKGELEASQALVEQLQTQATDLDVAALTETSNELQEHTSNAAAGTRDVTWRVAEAIPVLGSNLYAVRAITESIDEIIDQVAVPGIGIVGELTEGNGGAGGINLEPITRAQDVAKTARSVLDESLLRMDSINTSTTLGPVTEIVDQINGVLGKANDALVEAGPLIDASGDIIGQNGKRTYLLAFQNNAESTALGGSAASYTVMTVENGSVQIEAQAGSGDFVEGVPVDVEVDQSALDLYGSYLIDHINTSTSRPDFPTAASIMAAFWERDKATKVDGVISVDPIALGLILRATGPISLPSGDTLTPENAVSLLVSDIYFRYDSYTEPEKVDGFFASAAAGVLEKVTSGDFEVKDMLTSISDGIDQGSIMLWSATPSEQALMDGTRMQGVLPKENAEQTAIGVYYRDTSASKIDYYLETATNTSSDICTVPDSPTFSTTVTLHSTLTEEQAEALPDYVKSFAWGAEKFRTEVFVYGPVGSTVATTSVDSEGMETIETGTTDDLGRPVASYAAYLAPGETTSVTTTFTGVAGSYGPLVNLGTPMINATQNTIDPAAVCG